MRRRPVSVRVVVVAAAVSLLACDPYYPEVADDRLIVMAPLNIDKMQHRVLAWPVYTAAEPPAAVARLYRGTPRQGGFSWTFVAMDDVPGQKMPLAVPGHESPRQPPLLLPGAGCAA